MLFSISYQAFHVKEVLTIPKESMNVYFSIIDNGSPTLTKLTDKTKALNKETQQRQQSFHAMNKSNGERIKKKPATQGALQTCL